MSESATPHKPPPKRILVVDDEPLVADTIKMMLSGMGHIVEIANNAENALRAFEVGKYDLVTTDLQMPGMGGLELARLLKTLCKTQPIILISGSIHEARLKRVQLDAIDGVVCKPFTLVELANAVARAMA